MARDLLMRTIGDYIRESKPKRHRGPKFHPVSSGALQAAKSTSTWHFWRSPRKAEFARRIGIPKTRIERLFSLRQHSRLDQIEAAFAAPGKRLPVEARNAALRYLLDVHRSTAANGSRWLPSKT